MKYTFLFLILFLQSYSFSQKDTLTSDELVYVFQEILRTDQTHYKMNSIRYQVFECNFNKIISITKNQGFPSLTKKYWRKKKKNSIKIGSLTTFLHTFQTDPNLILNDSITTLFKKEIEAGRLEKKILHQSIWAFVGIHKNMVGPIDEELKNKINYAIKEWGIDLNKL